MKKFLIALAIVVAVVLILPLLLPRPADRGGPPVEGLPWQIEVLPDGGSRVFGLTLGASTLADALARFGRDAELAIVAAPGETGSLEAYFDPAEAGPITGKLVATAAASTETLAAMLARSPKFEYMKSSTKKYRLAEADHAAALASPLQALAFIPSANLDEAMILQRFGPPAERIRAGTNAEHFLYPDRGLDVVLDSEGKEVLQYVAPRDFARLRDPLKATEAKP